MSQPDSHRSPFRGSRLVSQAQAGRPIQKSGRYIKGYRVGPRSILVDLDEIEAQFRVVPVQTMRDGRRPYGPKATIVDLSHVVLPVPDADR